jgi:sterol-4alpha-carboxylate 3-dehydrogenase (decarboxylating)
MKAQTSKKSVGVGTEYPYEPLYRPWSWILSSAFNIFLFAAILGVLYLYFRSRRNKKERHIVTYRTVQVRESPRKLNEVPVLVTGGNGALGREIIKCLLADGNYAVYSLDILLPEEDNRVDGVCAYIQADITNHDDLRIAFKDIEAVFHCASLTPVTLRHSKDDYHRVNVVGTENVIKACAEFGVKRLIYTSSASVNLSKNPKLRSCDVDETFQIPSDPLNAYVATKGTADQLVRNANGKSGVNTCVLRPNVFLHSIFAAIDENPYCPNYKDFDLSVVPVEAVAQAHLLAEKKLSSEDGISVVAGKAYNICDQKITLPEFAKFVASEKKTSVIFVPFPLVYLLAVVNEVTYRVTGIVPINESLSTTSLAYGTHTYVSDLARRELGWGPSKPWKEEVKRLLQEKQQGNKKED